MRTLPVLLNLSGSVNSLFANTAFEGKRRLPSKEFETDTFVRREDNYTKAYKTLVLNAHNAKREDSSAKIGNPDVQFLLDIKDYNKFRAIISAPVEIPKRGGSEEQTNIFFYTDENATRRLAKRLNNNGDRAVLKKLLSYRNQSRDTLFHKIAEEDDVKKARALKENLSVKEFKRFMQANNCYYETPYSIAKENNGSLKTFLEPLFEEESL